ncbi:MAG: hypothetical protein OXL96_00225 [Candidatus Poribacteria bacterium]|nr:hypothetical protein [Candidatus Poribacteria bacterium]
MKMTKIFVQTLCILCLAFGYVAESSARAYVFIEFVNVARDLPIDWRPTAGGSLSFSVKVTKLPGYSGGDLTATLSEVTNYTGSCGNVLSPYNDLELRTGSNPGWRVGTAKVSLTHPLQPNPFSTKETVEYMTVVVDCADYAAYGRLTFTAGGSTAPGPPISVIMPRDENGNKIADCWRNDETTADPNNSNASKNYVASADVDAARINTQLGDNMTVLDEYRGLLVNGSWTDTDPETWDVFMRIEEGLSSLGGLPEGISVYAMNSGEVNYNQGLVMKYQASSLSVYAIRLKSNPIAFDPKNPTAPPGEMGLGPPSSGTKGEVRTERIKGIVKRLKAGQSASGITAYVTTHEIGHGISLQHCPNLTDLDCYMWSVVGPAAHHVTQYHSHHDREYDLKFPTSGVQLIPATIPKGKKRHYDPKKKEWSLKSDSSGSALLSPSGGLYAAAPGSSHTAEFTSTVAYSSVSWYVKTPSDASAVFQRTDNGNGSSTSASYAYTFPSGTSGDYVFRAKGTAGSTGFDVSYTVTVSTSTPTPTPAPAPAPAPPSVSLAPSSFSPTFYTAINGDNHYATLTLGAAASSVSWYVQEPGQASPKLIWSGSVTTISDLSYWFPTGVTGDYVISVSGTWASDGSTFTASYTVWVGSPPPE